ncbi:MAG: hypothetical protein IT320_27390 [Anaerolineae bacterium]|nr:hypothetical protein [Anaerolineae bacterium]
MFDYRTALPIDVVAQRLQALHQPATNILQTWCKRVVFTPRHEGGFDFEIHGQEHKLSGDKTIVEAIGTLSSHPVTNETVLAGRWSPTYREFLANTLKGLVIFLGIVAVLVLVFVEDVDQRSRAIAGFGAIASLVCVWLFYEYWRNRRGLSRALQAAIEQAMRAEDA